MNFFTIFSLVLVVVCQAKPYDVVLRTKEQPTKGWTDWITYFTFHYQLKCEARHFKYFIELNEQDRISPDFLGHQWGSGYAVSGGVFHDKQWTDGWFSDFYDFTVHLGHNCSGVWKNRINKWNIARCPTKNRNCEFFFEYDLGKAEEIPHDCNNHGDCDVIFV